MRKRRIGGVSLLCRKQWLGASVLALLTVAGACDHRSPTAPTVAVADDGPRITAFSPPTAIQTDERQLITVLGAGFAAGLSVEVTDPDGGLSLLSNDDIQEVTKRSFEVFFTPARPGLYAFQVQNLTGLPSEPALLTVVSAATPGPVITVVTPDSLTCSKDLQTVQLIGVHFDPNLSVQLTDPDGLFSQVTGASVQVLSSTQVQLSAVFNRAGLYTISTANPSGEISNTVSVAVIDARPRNSRSVLK